MEFNNPVRAKTPVQLSQNLVPRPVGECNALFSFLEMMLLSVGYTGNFVL